ncbi:hypothetical protein KP509_09G046800 [Ceratopteris richardii]|uniref:Uncharacterized protein n=1 Tax=Ceratopteris richardii TaxID=49495 RepID=A0A8T2U7Q8_CERRI|nr:hypothetical protein KP509_09G046800 [Ceratopteris richardii]
MGTAGPHVIVRVKLGWGLEALFSSRRHAGESVDGRQQGVTPELSSLIWALCIILVLLLFLAVTTRLAFYYHSCQSSQTEDPGLSDRAMEDHLQPRRHVLVFGLDTAKASKLQMVPQPVRSFTLFIDQYQNAFKIHI